MSTATTLAKPLARLITQCPYCDHVSPVGSKFCGECGAALHLLPCPHCGAVNDITVATACYRCHKELREKIPVAAPAPTAFAPAETKSLPAETLPYIVIEPPARQRPHALAVGIVLIAFAAAGYYAYRQRSMLVGRDPVPAAAEVKGRDTSAGPDAKAVTSNVIKAPVDAVSKPSAIATEKSVGSSNPVAAPVELKTATPDAEPAREAPVAVRSNAGRPVAAREAVEAPVAAIIVTPETVRARLNASKGLEKQPAYGGPCTDAVAALGLCTPEPTPRRQ